MTQESISIDIATDVRSLTKAWHSKIKIAMSPLPGHPQVQGERRVHQLGHFR